MSFNYIKEMIWLKLNIFNNDQQFYLKNLCNAGKLAKTEGYDFLKFNGIVYFIDNWGNLHQTSIES